MEMPAVLLMLLTGCLSEPTKEEVARQIVQGSLQPPPKGGVWAEPLGQWEALGAERETLRASERLVAVTEAASEASEERWEGVLAAAGRGLEVAPKDPDLNRWISRIEVIAAERVGREEWAGAALLYGGLSQIEAPSEKREAWERLAASLSERFALSERYAPDALAATRQGQRGIELASALEVLETVSGEFVETLDLDAWMARIHARMLQLATDRNARLAFPTLAGGRLEGWLEARTLPQSATLEGARAQLRQLVEAAEVRGGVPREVAIFELMDAGVGGLDPWSRVIWPEDIARWEGHHAGVVVGIGLEMMVSSSNEVVVAYPWPGSPADEAGLHQGDVLESVDGVRFDDRVGEARRQALEGALLGAEDAWVEVGVTRSGEPKVFKVVRRRLLPDVITGWRRDEDNRWRFWLDEAHGIAYARVVSFRPHTDEAFDEALSELVGLRAVILDLRGNPGGDVNAAVNLMDRFVAHGWLARLEGRVMPDVGSDVDPETGERLAAWNEAIPGHALEGVPLAILVDRFSASSAEIVAGGLQELVGADVIGERTVGKGLSQVLRADPEGRYALQFTNLYWALPSGQRIDAGSAHGGGVLPAIVDPLSPAEQFWVSVLERRRGAVRQHADGSPVLDVSTVGRPDLPVLDRDPHVRRAHLLLRARQVLEGVEREP